MARAMLDARDHLPIDDAKRLVDQEVLLHGKLQAALEFRLSEATAPQFLKTFLNYDLARKKLEFAREKFQHKCEVALQKAQPTRSRPGSLRCDGRTWLNRRNVNAIVHEASTRGTTRARS